MHVLGDIGDRIGGAREDSAAASVVPVDASPASRVNTAINRLPTTATTDERNRRISLPAVSPDSSAPAEKAATANPNTVLDNPRSALISG